MLNLLKSQKRHQRPEAGYVVVALSDADAEIYADEDPNKNPATAFERAEDDELPAWAQEVIAGWTQQERAFFALMQESEWRTPRFARVLCITHIPLAEQRRQVKRLKDRLTKRLQRARGRGHVRGD